jgi:hypothetical protein
MVVEYRCPACGGSSSGVAQSSARKDERGSAGATVTVTCDCGRAASVSAPSFRSALERKGWSLLLR